MSNPKFCEIAPTKCTCGKIQDCPNKEKEPKRKKK